MASIQYQAGAITTQLSTELNNLANNGRAIATTAYDNATNLYLYGFFELNVTFGSAPTAGNLIELYLIPSPDGTNYDDGDASVDPPFTTYVGGFPLRAVTTAQKVPLGGPGVPALIPLPPLRFKVHVINKSGQAFPASGSTVRMVPYRYQTV